MQAKDLISSSLRLRALPKVYYQLQQLLDSEQASSATIAHCLRNDPALSAHVLRIANSSLYNLSSKIDTISRAVTVIGHNAVHNQVLASSAVGMFNKRKMPYFNIREYWEHSLRSAILAQKLAEQCQVLHSESYFVGGLLHDIGTMVIAMKLPELARTLYMHFPDEIKPQHEIEFETLGFTHADVGGELLASWALSAHLVEAVRHHEQPEGAPESPFSAAIIQIASAYVQCGFHDTERLEHMIDPFSWRISGLHHEQLPRLLLETEGVFAETFSLFFTRAA